MMDEREEQIVDEFSSQQHCRPFKILFSFVLCRISKLYMVFFNWLCMGDIAGHHDNICCYMKL